VSIWLTLFTCWVIWANLFFALIFNLPKCVYVYTIDKWVFPVSGANVWNSLPPHVTFRQHLKTFLFHFSYPDLVIWLAPCYILLWIYDNSCYLGHSENPDDDDDYDDDDDTVVPSVVWYCWLGDRKGIRPIKTSAPKPLGMAVFVTLSPKYHVGLWVWRVLACLVSMLRLRMTRDWDLWDKLANPDLLGKWRFKWCVCDVHTMLWNLCS